MCGIAGIIEIQTHAPKGGGQLRGGDFAAGVGGEYSQQVAQWKQVLGAMEGGIAHRGPDAHGVFFDRVSFGGMTMMVGLVQRRLTILDDSGGGQPMVAPRFRGGPSLAGADDALLAIDRIDRALELTRVEGAGADLSAVVFNGCIYNHRKLRGELEGFGHRFVSDHSDTEVVLRGAMEWGGMATKRLEGMYAFASYVRGGASGVGAGPRVVLCRDRAGEKPLYVHTQVDAQRGVRRYVFGSTVSAVVLGMRELGMEVRVDRGGVLMWLKHGYWGRMPVNVEEVPPGGVLTIDGRGESLDRFGVEVKRGEDLSESKVAELCQRAVGLRLESDVPLGCFLSGGVDSSIVAAVASKEIAKRGGRLKTFTVRVPGSKFDETGYARMVAEHLKTEHVELECQGTGSADLVMLIGQLGLPFGDSSLLPTYWVSKAARGHVTVALGGDGGDELFAGYDRYLANAYMHKLERWSGGLGRVIARGPISLRGRLGRVQTAIAHYGYFDLHSIFKTPELGGLVDEHELGRTLAGEYAQGQRVGADARHEDFGRYLPMDLMRKVDTAAMAVGLEVRAPLLDSELIARALGAPLSRMLKGDGRGGVRGRKALLTEVSASMVPRGAVVRKKAGFGIPIGQWFRDDFAGLGSLARGRLGSGMPMGRSLDGIVDAKRCKGILDEHMGGGRGSSGKDHSQRLWMLTVMSVWGAWLDEVTGK